LIGISDSLPTTATIKMVEVWMLFCLFMPFLEVVLQSHVQACREEAEKEEEEEEEEFVRKMTKDNNGVKKEMGGKVQVYRAGRLITVNTGSQPEQRNSNPGDSRYDHR
jgi:hypothetical protein